MIIAITGTPGTGKTSISKGLIKKGFNVIDLNKIAYEKKYLLGKDEKRNSFIIDTNKLDIYIKKNYKTKELIFIEGHLSHLLNCVDIVIILRLNPSKLKNNLLKRKWKKEKINENLEAEILDIILCETIQLHSPDKVMEIDTSENSLNETIKIIINLVENNFKNIKKYKIGKIDWSKHILKEF